MMFSALLSSLFGYKKKVTRRTIAQYKQDLLVKSGKEQFQYLLKKHLQVPVVLL